MTKLAFFYLPQRASYSWRLWPLMAYAKLFLESMKCKELKIGLLFVISIVWSNAKLFKNKILQKGCSVVHNPFHDDIKHFGFILVMSPVIPKNLDLVVFFFWAHNIFLLIFVEEEPISRTKNHNLTVSGWVCLKWKSDFRRVKWLDHGKWKTVALI